MLYLLVRIKNKLITFFNKLISLFFYCLFVFIRFFRKYRIVVFDSSRIGHMMGMMGYYLRKKELDVDGTMDNDILVCMDPVANETFYEMIESQVRVIKSNFLMNIINISRINKPIHPEVTRLRSILYDPDVYKKTSSPFVLTEKQMKNGLELLSSMGIPENEPVICFAVRDRTYLQKMHPGRHWGYHDFRNGSLDDYLYMANKLTEEGFWLVRMGAIVETPLVTDNPKIIDYATNYRSDFGDVFLAKWSYMFISDNSGITHIARAQGTGGVRANLGLGDVFWPQPDYLSLPSLYKDKSTGKLLTFKESIQMELHIKNKISDFEEAGVEVVHNSAEELTHAVKEKHLKMTGNWINGEYDDELQKEFFALYPGQFCPSYFLIENGGTIPIKSLSPIATSFLRKYSYLINN